MVTASPRRAPSSSRDSNSPFGMALVGNDLYVANTDAIVRFPYNAGRRPASRRRRARSSTCPAGPPTTIGPRTSSRAAMARSSTRPSARTATSAENGIDAGRRPRRDLGDRPARPERIASSRPVCAIRMAWPGSRRPARCGRSSTSATSSAAISFPTTSRRCRTALSTAGRTATTARTSIHA